MLSHRLCRRAGLLPALVLSLLVLAPATGASGAATSFQRDRTPLPTGVTGSGGGGKAAAHDVATSGAAIHMLFGLALVLALIYALYRLLKRSASKNDKKTVRGDGWMSVIASTPLAPGRSVHLIRVGEEIVLIGSGEQSVTPIRVYSAEEARQLRIEPREPLALDAGPPGDAAPSFLLALLESLRRMTAR